MIVKLQEKNFNKRILKYRKQLNYNLQKLDLTINTSETEKRSKLKFQNITIQCMMSYDITKSR